MANKNNECLVDEVMDVVDPEKVLANRRKYVRDALKPAEEAKDELEKATATKEVRLQGTKETKAPSLKPYTESFDVKDRHELGKLISGAKRDNRTWSVERCSDEKLKEGYRYTFRTTKLQEVFTESLNPNTRTLNEEDEDELPINPDEIIELELGSDEIPATEESEAEKAIAILKKLFNFHGGDKPNSFVVCLMDGDKEEQCIEIPEIPEDDLNTLHAVLFEPEEMGKEPEAEVEVEETPEEDAVVLDLGEGLKEEKTSIHNEDDLIDEIISVNKLNHNKIDKYGSEEYWIDDSIRNLKDLDDTWKTYIKGKGEDLEKAFLAITGYEIEDEEEPQEESLNEEKEEEPKLETFDEQMDFLAADEQEAIDGYKKVLDLVEDEHVKEQLQHIMDEEIAHKDFLELVKEDRTAVYSHEEAPEEFDTEVTISSELPPVELEEPIQEPELTEASSAEKKAFKHGGEDQKDLEFGRALARIKDPHERAMLLNQKRMEKAGNKMSDRPETDVTLKRHLDNVEKDFVKKQKSMSKAGMQDDDGILNEAAKISLDDLRMFNPWGGAKDIWELLVAQEKLDDLDKALEDMYPEGITASELNDILWFEQDWVIEKTGVEPFLKRDDAIEVEAEIIEPEEEK